MPGYKITDLTSLGALAADGPNDLLEVVDVSDTVTAPADASGSNKKVTIHDLVLAANQNLTPPFDTAALVVNAALDQQANTLDHVVKLRHTVSYFEEEEVEVLPATIAPNLLLEKNYPGGGTYLDQDLIIKAQVTNPSVYGDANPHDVFTLGANGNMRANAVMIDADGGDLSSFGVLNAAWNGLRFTNTESNQIGMNVANNGGLFQVTSNAGAAGLRVFRTGSGGTNWASVGFHWNSNNAVIETKNGGSSGRGELRFDVLTSVAPLTTNNTTLGTTSLRWSTIFGTALTIGSGLTALTGASNASALTVAGGNLTGSNSTNAISLTQTWNTTGSPKAISVNITNTASGAGARLLDLQTGGTSRFSVDVSGAAVASALKLGASSASKSSLNVAAGSAPSAPVDGDIWFDGTDLFFRAGGVTKQIAVV